MNGQFLEYQQNTMTKIILLIFIIFTFSCNNKEKAQLIEIQEDYIQELLKKNELLLETLKSNYFNNSLSIDSQTLVNFRIYTKSFELLMIEFSKDNFYTYFKTKKQLLKYTDTIFKYPSNINLIKLNTMKIKLIQDCNKIYQYFLYNHHSIYCGITQLKVRMKLNKIQSKSNFLKNGEIFLFKDYKSFFSSKVYIGVLDTSFFKPSDTLLTNNLYNGTKEDIRLEKIYEVHTIDFNKNGTFALNNIKTKIKENKLEGLMTMPNPAGGYDYYAFRYYFEF